MHHLCIKFCYTGTNKILKMLTYVSEKFHYGGKTLDCTPIIRVLQGKGMNMDTFLYYIIQKHLPFSMQTYIQLWRQESHKMHRNFMFSSWTSLLRCQAGKKLNNWDIIQLTMYTKLAYSEMKYWRHSTTKSINKVQCSANLVLQKINQCGLWLS